MASFLWVALLVQLLMLANPGSGVAPGDEETLCEELRPLGVAPTPAYSTNMRVLMDSWNYQNLLPPRMGAVWDQVDNDTRNSPSLTTNWIQNSNRPCEQSVQVCGFSAGPQDNWLITQLINRTANGTRLSQVSVTIEFEFRNCDITLNCQQTFNTHIYETSTENGTAARNVSNYRQVQRVSSSDTTETRMNETIVTNFNSEHSSFYFAIQDENSCIVVNRLLVFYHVCPASSRNDPTRIPETIVAGISSVVRGYCAENAQTRNNNAHFSLLCLSGGAWFPPIGGQCQCLPGYAYDRENEKCTASNQLACESLDNLISNSINTRELECVRKSDCSGVQCFSQNSFLKNFVELFDFTFLPCAKPTPVLWLQLLGREDPTNNNRRNVVLSRNVTESGNVSFSILSGGGDIEFGSYKFIANFLEDYSTVAIAAQLISGGTTSIVDYTEIWFDSSKCPIESTTAPPTTTDTPTAPPLITTTAVPPTSGPVLTPPEIEPHCTHVNWRNSPNVSCGDISGYDVRLFNPDTNETVERRVDTRGTFHNFLESDKDLLEKKSTAVQIRVVSSTNIGPYSSPKEVGCYKSQPSSVYFELNKERYENNSMVSILNIGEGDDALLCKTDKQDCCGTRPNRFGEFYYPHGVRVPINSARQDFYRDRGEQLIRLNRREGTSSPTGRYRCEIPDANGINQKIFINITQ